MRTILLLSLFYCLTSKAQSDTLWPNLNASWIVEAHHYDGAGGNISKTFHYHQESDSIYLNSKYWHTFKSYSSVVGLISFTDQKVYFKCTQPFKIAACCSNYSDTSEVILYDFSGSVGDTVDFDYGGSPIQVNNISDTLFDNVERTVFYLSNGDIWIAGEGSVNGIFPLDMVDGIGFSNSLCRFEGFYRDSLNVDYTLSQGVLSTCVASLVESDLTSLVVVSQSSLKITLNQPEILHIYSVSGSLINSFDLQTDQNSIDLNSFENGVYFYQIGTSESGKFILSR